MKGDFSRLRDNRGGYSRVMMQQGRVLLDSDWNEQAALMQEMVRRLARDLYGAHGGPGEELGFRIFHKGQDGLDEKEAWRLLLGSVTQEQKMKLQDLFGNSIPITGPGRYYVDGRAAVNSLPVPYTNEADSPFDGVQAAFDPSKKPWLAYLDVWEDYVSPEQDSELVEVALGGPDTCGRAKTMWRVRIKQGKTVDDLSKLKPTGGGLLTAFTDGKPQPDELCVISPDHQYRGVENQLYRVEIHKGGKVGEARFKWSRDNGSLVYPILGSVKNNVFELARLGRDKISALSEDGWVEFIDDDFAAGPGVGVMAKVEKIDKDNSRVTLKFAGGFAPALQKGSHPLLRRWDHSADGDGCIKLEEGVNKALEDGINIKFAESDDKANYRAGDYWLIPARVATGEVDWPAVNSLPVPLPPHGPLHSYAPLLLVTENGKEIDWRVKCEMTRTQMKSS
jgi:Family of unknown function (DUF6519)